MKYEVVAATSFHELAKLINQALQTGWLLQGGIAVVVSDKLGEFVFYQAITKEGE